MSYWIRKWNIFASGNIIAGNTLKGLNLEINGDVTAVNLKHLMQMNQELGE